MKHVKILLLTGITSQLFSSTPATKQDTNSAELSPLEQINITKRTPLQLDDRSSKKESSPLQTPKNEALQQAVNSKIQQTPREPIATTLSQLPPEKERCRCKGGCCCPDCDIPCSCCVVQ